MTIGTEDSESQTPLVSGQHKLRVRYEETDRVRVVTDPRTIGLLAAQAARPLRGDRSCGGRLPREHVRLV